MLTTERGETLLWNAAAALTLQGTQDSKRTEKAEDDDEAVVQACDVK